MRYQFDQSASRICGRGVVRCATLNLELRVHIVTIQPIQQRQALADQIAGENCALLSGDSCGPDPAFARAIAAVNGKLTDPQSARYDDMVRKVGPNLNGKPAEVVCGSVAAQDSFGGNGGKRPFVYFIADGATFLVEANPQPEDVAQIIYGRFCK
jgi:hypothetical protein